MDVAAKWCDGDGAPCVTGTIDVISVTAEQGGAASIISEGDTVAAERRTIAAERDTIAFVAAASNEITSIITDKDIAAVVATRRVTAASPSSN